MKYPVKGLLKRSTLKHLDDYMVHWSRSTEHTATGPQCPAFIRSHLSGAQKGKYCHRQETHCVAMDAQKLVAFSTGNGTLWSTDQPQISTQSVCRWDGLVFYVTFREKLKKNYWEFSSHSRSVSYNLLCIISSIYSWKFSNLFSDIFVTILWCQCKYYWQDAGFQYIQLVE